MRKIIAAIDGISLQMGKLVSWLTLLMALLTLLIVVLRYGFDLGWIALQESVMYMHATVFLLGAAHTLKVDEHVRVDVLYRRFGPRKKALVNLLGTLLLLLPVSVFIFVASFDFVMASWRLMETSQEAGGLPLVYALKTLMLVFSASLILQAVAQALRHWQQFIAAKHQEA